MRDMDEAKQATRKIKAMLRGRIAFDFAEAARLGGRLANHGERIPSLFPDTAMSRGGKATEALPTVWSRWDEFEKMARDTVLAAERLSAAAVAGDRAMLSDELNALAEACKSCHENYRED